MVLPAVVLRETTYIASLAREFWRLRDVKPDSPVTIVDIFEGQARRTPESLAILCGEDTVSYGELNALADRYAQWARGQEIERGSCVALLMENRPEYIAVWLGLFKLGVVVALINTNLRGAALAHSIAACAARHLVLGDELTAEYLDARSLIPVPPRAWVTGGVCPSCDDLDAALNTVSSSPADPGWRHGLVCKDLAFYIFTSGTTGPPKAANISHFRTLFMMHGFAGAIGTTASDRIYDVLPLYHSAGGICGPGMALTVGGSLVIRRKFSVHEFWNDCARHRPTVFQYIGELCRYLLNAPPSPHERDHALRAIIGNGLRPDIWAGFQSRFAIPRIIEFYGATEGNVALVNYDGKVGAVGRIPCYARGLFRTRIVRFDIENGTPVRDAEGFCMECADGEVGEAIGKITSEPKTRFEGYTRESDTEKKVLRHVFQRGDAWFRTGDLMKRDCLGYYYFVDRIGDTFRWKGENVATSEVAEVLQTVMGISEANVYGVEVPGYEGRAGMAALVVGPEFDVAGLAGQLKGNLADFARPVFLRLLPQMEVTGTFKQRKVDLAKEGFDPERINTPLYVLDSRTSRYEPLDATRYDDVISGRLKL
ncbi:MAG TPA: long-chain-acyl-CoA synthetase [Rhizomicrobium sp.]|jgi:fatty-acyl-CoA synthase|nr:long-chain-acyl-CoA synthetase [Rhizomicrobium sp.]